MQGVIRLCRQALRRTPTVDRMTLEVMPRPATLDAPTPEFMVLLEPPIPLWWRADHTLGNERVTGGLRGARALIGAIDGTGWPWTTLTSAPDSGAPWAQAIGEPGALVVELSSDGGPRIVFVRSKPRGRTVKMPAACRRWVPNAFVDELHTADEGMRIALRHLLGLPLDPQLGLRRVRTHEHRRR